MRAILFDLDGTLVDSVDQHAQAWAASFSAFGHQVSYRRIRAQIGKGSDTLLPTFLSKHECRVIGPEIDEVRGKIFRHRFLGHVRPFPAVERLVRRLREKGFKIALASSADRRDVDHYLRLLGIARLVDAATSADDVQRSKPHADIFAAARRRLRLPLAARCVVVGDSPFDAIAARRAHMRAIGFLSGGFGASKLKRAGCEEIYRDPLDLLRRLDGSRVLRDLELG